LGPKVISPTIRIRRDAREDPRDALLWSKGREREPELLRRLKATRGILLERLHDDGLELGWDVVLELRRLRDRIGDDACDGRRGRSNDGGAPCEALVENDTERPDVAALVRGLAVQDLLGGHVEGRAEARATLGHTGLALQYL